MTGPLLRFEAVTVVHGHSSVLGRAADRILGRADHRLVAVDTVNLDIQPGTATGIVGESGSGKTTLMRTALGLQVPTSGQVRFRGEPLPVRRTRAQRRSIQMVFQDPGTTLNPAHTVADTLGEALRVHHIVPRAQIDARVGQLLDLVHLPQTVRGALPHTLSGGQKQRVAIARALAVEPEIVIADEATSALDVVVQAAILDLLVELRRETGVTLVCVSHDLELVRYLCDDVAVLQHGKIVEAGKTSETLSMPQNAYTAELLAAAPSLPIGGEQR